MSWFHKRKSLPENLSICIVANKFPILGRAADHGFLWPIARAMARRGHRVVVLSWKNPQGKKEIFQDQVQAYFLGEPLASNPQRFSELALRKFLELHTQSPFHIVHSVDASGLPIGLRRRELGIAMTYDVEATKMAELFAIIGLAQETPSSFIGTGLKVATRYLLNYYGHDRKVLSSADGIFVTTPQQRLALERHFFFPEMKTHSVPYGSEVGDLSPREKSDETRKKLGLPASSPIAVTKSDMTELEVMKSLLGAFARVAVKRPSARLLILGDGPLKKQIEFEMLSLALGSKVVFASDFPNTEVPECIALADVYINLSSRTSGFEPAMLEAMAQKKPVVGSEMSPMATLIADGEDGFLVRPADMDGISELLLQIFTGQIPVQAVGERAQKKVMELFDLDRMVQQTLDAYRKALVATGWYRPTAKTRRPTKSLGLESSL